MSTVFDQAMGIGEPGLSRQVSLTRRCAAILQPEKVIEDLLRKASSSS
jgi:hypothetical protein